MTRDEIKAELMGEAEILRVLHPSDDCRYFAEAVLKYLELPERESEKPRPTGWGDKWPA